MAEGIDQEGRAAFVLTLPRKVAELRATLGTLVADPKSQRMRDELRRRLHAVYTLTRSYNLPTLSEGLREGLAHVDAIRPATVLSQRDMEMLADLIATLPALAQRDLPDHPELFTVAKGRTSIRAPGATEAPPGAKPTATSSAGAAGRKPSSMAVPAASRPPSVAPPRRGTVPQFTAVRVEQPVAAPPPRPPPSANALVGVLVVGSDATVALVREVVGPDAEVGVARALAEAVTAARDTAPDVVIAEVGAPADGLGLLVALRGDPLTDFIPIVLLAAPGDGLDADTARTQGAADVLPLPPSAEALHAAIEQHAQGMALPELPPPTLNELTLEELTQTLTDEIRRGILGAAGPRSGGTRVSLGQGSEVLAATWEAIARVRDIVEKKTGGKVRFEVPAALGLGGAHVLSIGEEDEELARGEGAAGGDDPLPGHTALVVDDDPGVVWFFAGLLRDAKMNVIECTDGVSALRNARRVRPDLVISDILMPGLDGFALCRAIRRDVSLRYTPVILISWKEDLLLRMRELGAQAQGFLRKESRGEAILTRVRAVLRPRVRMLKRLEHLAESAELRGRIERVGVFALLESSARALRDATVTVSDSYSVTELELREGALVSAVRTAQDGSLTRGEGALLQVLGVSTARFAVKRSSAHVRPNVQGDLAGLLAGGAALISALEDSLSGAALLEVASIDADGEAALAYARSLPETMRSLVERIVKGESPRNLVLRDGIAPQELEPVLVELARRGAIRSVRGAEGEDLVAPRFAAARSGESLRPSEQAALASSVSQSMPAVPRPPAMPAFEPVPAEPPPRDTAHTLPGVGATDAMAGLQALVSQAEPPRETTPGGWAMPTSVDEAARPGFGLESEADTLASAVLRELSAPVADLTDDDVAMVHSASREPAATTPTATPASTAAATSQGGEPVGGAAAPTPTPTTAASAEPAPTPRPATVPPPLPTSAPATRSAIPPPLPASTPATRSAIPPPLPKATEPASEAPASAPGPAATEPMASVVATAVAPATSTADDALGLEELVAMVARSGDATASEPPAVASSPGVKSDEAPSSIAVAPAVSPAAPPTSAGVASSASPATSAGAGAATSESASTATSASETPNPSAGAAPSAGEAASAGGVDAAAATSAVTAPRSVPPPLPSKRSAPPSAIEAAPARDAAPAEDTSLSALAAAVSAAAEAKAPASSTGAAPGSAGAPPAASPAASAAVESAPAPAATEAPSAPSTAKTEAGARAGSGDDVLEIEAGDEAEVSIPADNDDDVDRGTLEPPPRDLDSRGLPRRRSQPELPELTGPNFEPHEPIKPATAAATPSSSIIVDPVLVTPPLPKSGTTTTKTPATRPSAVDTEPTGHKAVRAEPEDDRARSGGGVWLVLAVLALGALSFFAMRAYLRSQHPLEAPGAHGGAAEADAGAASGASVEDAARAGSAADASSASEGGASDGSSAGATGVDVSSADASSASASSGTGASPYVDPQPFLNGAALAPDRGLLVIESPGRTGVEVSIDRRAAVRVPTSIPLQPGMHDLRFPLGGVTGYRLVTVRAGRAIRVLLPAEP